jgi:hypothetical protein
MKKSLELSWDILQERENSVVRVLVSKGVEDKAFLGYESVSVGGSPVSYGRFKAPR